MKVKCITNKGSDLPKEMLEQDNSCTEHTTFSMKVDKEYLVYAMGVFEGYVWYCICDENFSSFPTWKPSFLFEIVDNRLSHYWVFSQNKELTPGIIDSFYPIWSFPEWAEDEYYYHNLIDWCEKEEILFNSYKKLMDLEFPDPTISQMAQIGDKDWLMCPICIDAWLSPSSQDAMVMCPKCQTVFKNPRYAWDKEIGKATSFLPKDKNI